MKTKEIKIGGITTPNNLFLAPLAGFTDAPFRQICSSLGAGLTFTEMVSAKGLKYNSEKTKELLFTYDNEKIKAVQIFGSDPIIMGEVAKSEHLSKFDIIDINMGCPVSKVYSNGEGSALLNDLTTASKIISEVKKSGKAVTCKFRIGVSDDAIITKEFAKMCEDSGADLITIHGRTKKAVYSGECNFKEIESAKNAVKIPVIANGGVFTKTDADIIMDKTGADGVMLARGALENPLLFSEILNVTPKYSLKECILTHVELAGQLYGDKCAVILRKQMAFYLKKIKGTKKAKEQIFLAKTICELKNIIQSVFN